MANRDNPSLVMLLHTSGPPRVFLYMLEPILLPAVGDLDYRPYYD